MKILPLPTTPTAESARAPVTGVQAARWRQALEQAQWQRSAQPAAVRHRSADAQGSTALQSHDAPPGRAAADASTLAAAPTPGMKPAANVPAQSAALAACLQAVATASPGRTEAIAPVATVSAA